MFVSGERGGGTGATSDSYLKGHELRDVDSISRTFSFSSLGGSPYEKKGQAAFSEVKGRIEPVDKGDQSNS